MSDEETGDSVVNVQEPAAVEKPTTISYPVKVIYCPGWIQLFFW